MTQVNRLDGGLIDRSTPLGFTFDGRRYGGFAGDTLASALVANGVRLVGRSFKYHRPRGIISAGSEEPNGLVELRTGARREPNSRVTITELHDGLVAASQNRFPSLGFDLMAVNDRLSNFLGAGFYYKTFMWPKPSGNVSTSRSSGAQPALARCPARTIRMSMTADFAIATCW